MHRALGAALLIVGTILLFMSYNASRSPSSDVSRLFSGDFSDSGMWTLLGGGAALAAGLVLVLFSRKRRNA